MAILLTLMAVAAPAANDIKTTGSFVSTVAPGTPPLEVTSTTRVDNLNAEYLDGWSAASFLRPLDNVITVSPSGGDFTSIQSALDSITDASFSNRYLVLVGPGTYGEYVTLKSWVSVEGAGPEATIIAAGGGDLFGFAATVTGADGAVLRGVRIESDGASANYSLGVLADGKPLLEDVHVVALGGAISSTGIYTSGGGSLQLRNAHVDAVGSPAAVGIYNLESGVHVARSQIRGYSGATTSYAIQNAAPSGDYVVVVESSYLEGASSYLSGDDNFVNYIRFSEVAGGSLISNGGTDICHFVIEGSSGSASTCP